MSYLILNGSPSNQIPGLLIQKLAPISLPPVRTQVETIDGRDGDIVTRLGYGAYDKQVSIGLYGDFDIDQIIEYFASEGTVIFSNEPDKYYKYQILNQIDFARLIRFRTATVTFHVQPFKYSADETPASASTSPLTVENLGNTFAKPKITITGSGTVSLYLNSTQIFTINMGTPEIEIIIDIEAMNAFDESGSLMNRSVTGNYESFVLPKGENTISWSGGTVSGVTVENYSRWL